VSDVTDIFVFEQCSAVSLKVLLYVSTMVELIYFSLGLNIIQLLVFLLYSELMILQQI